MDPALWHATRNAWFVLQSVGSRELDRLGHDRAFVALLERLRRRQRDTAGAQHWFASRGGARELRLIAFFCMEFGLSEALPLYAGGLGVLAGDYLKAASDLGVPAVGIGLLYSAGFFRQVLDADGRQRELYPPNDSGGLPILPARGADGAPLRIPIELPGRTVLARAWRVRVGRTSLYLLDCNDPQNRPADRGITAELYGGNDEVRLQQAIVLGIGGWRLLRALELDPEVCHLNEGHAALAPIERTRALMERLHLPFAEALRASRSGTVFTTHTPVEAAFDRFDAGLAAEYLAPYCGALGVACADLLALGRLDGAPASEPLNMAYFAMRCSGRVNGVSRLHAEVSRRLFAPLFPRIPLVDVPVGFVTNGVHTPSWDSAAADALWTTACGVERWRGDLSEVSDHVAGVADAALWSLRTDNRRRLVEAARRRLVRRLGEIGASAARLRAAQQTLDPDVLTLGFARRFTGYKRATLLLHEPERLARLLLHPTRPVQLVLAGKAHPNDTEGKEMIRSWVTFAERADVRERIAFLDDYDLLLAEELVQGADVWLNTPRRPREASGTSGMKVLVNGGLNASELDGWWAEAYEPEVGWALGGAAQDDDAEAHALYALLEDEIAPQFYARDADGIPDRWIAMMRASMVRLTARFSTNRMVREYVQGSYDGAAAAYRRRIADGGMPARALERAVRSLERAWPQVAVGSPEIDAPGNEVRVRVALGALDPALVRVELYADASAAHPRETIALTARTDDPAAYAAPVPVHRPASDFTARIVPNVSELALPLECALVRWQR